MLHDSGLKSESDAARLATALVARRPKWGMGPSDPIESVVAVLILVVLNVLALEDYDIRTLTTPVAAVEVLYLSASQRICMHESWAVNGECPAVADCVQNSTPGSHVGIHVSSVSAPLAEPSFAYAVSPTGDASGRRQIGIWLSAAVGSWPTTFAWHCGGTPVAPACAR